MGKEKRGPTPLGGNRSVAYLFDKTGAETDDFDAASTAEIVEYDGDEELGRTYVDLSPDPDTGGPPQYDDPGDPDSQDLGKTTWDIWDNVNGMFTLVATRDQLLHALGWDELELPEQRKRVANLLGLPSWEPAPASLKAEVYAWLESTRQE